MHGLRDGAQGFHAVHSKPHSPAHAAAAARAKRRQSTEARWPSCDSRSVVENSVLGIGQERKRNGKKRERELIKERGEEGRDERRGKTR